eukprot:Gb_13502 [translate_table: standard]
MGAVRKTTDEPSVLLNEIGKSIEDMTHWSITKCASNCGRDHSVTRIRRGGDDR